MNKNKAILVCAALFASYPTVNEFHVTTDGQAFAGKHDADAHASFLNKKEPVVVTVSRDDKADEDAEAGTVSAEQKAVNDGEALVLKLAGKLDKAAAKNKPAVQLELDEAKKALDKAKEALPA